MAKGDAEDIVPSGQGRVKNPAVDKRLARNRPGPTGQGRVADPAKDKRLRVNRKLETEEQ